MASGPRPIGSFCWINLLTPDTPAARTFFTKLLGWEFKEVPGMGHIITVGGHDVGGFWDLNHANTPPGLPPGIGVMVRVESAAATSALAKKLGGRGEPPREIGPTGTMAEIYDPVGANIDVWQAGSSPGATADPTQHGVPSWIEALTSDVERTAPFYRELFGWTSETMPMPGMDYTVFSNGGAPVAGMMAITREMGSFPPHWGTYITVADVDAAVAATRSLGGKVYLEPHDVPTVGRMAGITSPQGVMFYVIRYEQM